ncbi:MAG: CDP-glycerol--glycerophosphate glycerophosphotransferase [Treponema sp.]|nr:CDP-glycerol--glycerophosphate glycerophosphotransferase [Treponema sp.]
MQNLLYIDPGTGSMLFSVFIGIAATLLFLARAAWLKIQLIFSGKKAHEAVKAGRKKFVIYNEGRQYWNVFKPILDAFERRHIEVTYFTSYKQDAVFESNYAFVKAEYIGEGNRAFARLNLLSADIVLATTPGLDVYQWKRSKDVKHYAHILHAASDATMYRLFGLDYFDSVLLTGDYQKQDIKILENQRGLPQKELCTVGCPYLDALKEKISLLPKEENHSFTVLVSPSWGKDALLSKYGKKLIAPLLHTGWTIIIRPHPQSTKQETEMLKKLEDTYKECKTIVWDYESDNIISMSKSDIMISDFSGIIFDYTFLFDRPIMYVNADLDLRPYDAYDLNNGEKQLWQFEILKKFGIELREKQFATIKDVIQEIHNNKNLAEARKNAKEQAWQFVGEAGEKVVDFMIAKEKEIGAL